MNGKNPLASKTLWFNILALLLAVAAGYGFKEFVPTVEVEDLARGILALLAILNPIINMVLRLVTKAPIRILPR